MNFLMSIQNASVIKPWINITDTEMPFYVTRIARFIPEKKREEYLVTNLGLVSFGFITLLSFFIQY